MSFHGLSKNGRTEKIYHLYIHSQSAYQLALWRWLTILRLEDLQYVFNVAYDILKIHVPPFVGSIGQLSSLRALLADYSIKRKSLQITQVNPSPGPA
jgi:hypothetical protein